MPRSQVEDQQQKQTNGSTHVHLGEPMFLAEVAYGSIGGGGGATYRTGVTYCGYTTKENISVSQKVLTVFKSLKKN